MARPSILATAAALVVCLAAAAPTPGDDAQVAIAARFQRRLAKRFRSSLDEVTGALAMTLGVNGEVSMNRGTTYDPNPPFSKYELELIPDNEQAPFDWEGKWRYGCDDVNVTYEERTWCAIQELQALTGLCEITVEGDTVNQNVSTLVAFLLGERGEILDSLGVKRAPVPEDESLEMWMCETANPDEYLECPVVHAAAMLVMAQCGRTSKPSAAAMMLEGGPDGIVKSWFQALEKRFTRDAWRKLSYEENAIVWEALVLVSKLVADGSLKDSILKFVPEFEAFTHEQFISGKHVWSAHGANAAAQRWIGEEDAAAKEKYGQTVDDYLNRFTRDVVPDLNINHTYTCDLVRGLAPLLEKRDQENSGDLVAMAIHLMEKDIEFNQLRFIQMLENKGPSSKAMQTRMTLSQAMSHRPLIEGAFIRDMDSCVELDRSTIRVDDQGNCVVSLWRVMNLVAGLKTHEGEGDAQRAHLQDGGLRLWIKGMRKEQNEMELKIIRKRTKTVDLWRKEHEEKQSEIEEEL